jgi:hypothetical protein
MALYEHLPSQGGKNRPADPSMGSAPFMGSRANFRYSPSCRYRRKPDRNERLREQLIELAHQRPRFGYRRLGVLLCRDGQHVNHKRLFRVYREAGLWLNAISRRGSQLTTSKKKAEPKSNFGLPEERKYPMPDAAHARNAKARASQKELPVSASSRRASQERSRVITKALAANGAHASSQCRLTQKVNQ